MHIVQCLSRSTHGGAQTVVYTLVKTLCRIAPNIQHSIFLPPNGIFVERFRKLDVEVHEMPLDRLSPKTFWGMRNLLNGKNADVIHSHGKGAGLFARTMLASDIRSRLIHSFHGFHPPAHKFMAGVYGLAESVLAQRTDMVISVSAGEAEEIQNEVQSLRGKIVVIPNIVDREEVEENSTAPLEPRIVQFLSENSHCFLVAMIGRPDPLKNYPLALEASKLTVAVSDAVAFLFVGVNETHDGDSNVSKMLGGRGFTIPMLTNSASLLRRSDVLLITSKKEGSPLVVLEAFSLGKPVVGTNVIGIRDLITHRYNGFLCDDAAAISDALVKLTTDRQLYEKMSANALKTAMKMDLQVWANSYSRTYATGVN